MNLSPKIVFSRTLKNSEWDLTEIAGDEYVNEIKELKEKSGGDIISYGGCTFVSSLIKEDLIDEFYLFVNPVAIGEGMEIFKEKTILKLEEVRQFSCGVALLKYTPANK